MKFSFLKAFLSFALAVTVTSVFSLRSFAAIEATTRRVEPIVQTCGTLSVKAGTVTINGNLAQTGATVMSGSVVSTGSGEAVIDLGPAGRIELGDHTTATIICEGGSIRVRTTCDKTKVEVKTGQVAVETPKVETLSAGKTETYDGGINATAPAGVDVEIECVGKKRAGLFVGAGLIGLLALIGVGAAVAIGVGLGEGDIATAPSSPVVP
jgi:ribosomal 50S subunit-recycling heat shock protein